MSQPTRPIAGLQSRLCFAVYAPGKLIVMVLSHLQVVLRFVACLAAVIGCSGCKDTDRGLSSSSTVHPVQSSDATHAHPAETAAENLVSLFLRDELPSPRPAIPVLSKLSPDAQEEALQILGQYIRSQTWTLWFTEIVVVDGKEDVATCFFRGKTDEYLALMLAFQNDAWIVTGYEIPARPWARVNGETMEEYAREMLDEAKKQGEAYHNGTLADGIYLLEHYLHHRWLQDQADGDT